MVVLSTDVAVKELLDKRSNIYSHRPDMYVGGELASGNLRFLLMGYTSTWRLSRKLTHNLLNLQISKKYITYQDMENKQLMNDLLTSPKNFVTHLRRFSTSLSAIMIFGFRYPTSDDEEIRKLYEVIDEFSIVGRSPAAAMMDFYPILRYLPDSLNPITRRARELFQETLALYRRYWEIVKENRKNGVGVHSFAEDLVEVQPKEGIDETFCAFMAGMLMEGGSDTTATTLTGFIQAMVMFPHAQEKCHEEIDRVIGKERFPTIDDWQNLPYVRCCVKEILRWLPPATLGMPHATTQEDQYLGYKIPKGAQVICNIWAINMNEDRASDPLMFNPDRYLGDDLTAGESAALPDATKRDHFTFGAGRRICQGMHVAERSLFLGISRFLWCFDFKKAKGPDGRLIDLNLHDFSEGIIINLAPFDCQILPRDQARADMIRSEWKEAKAMFAQMNLHT